MNRWLWLETFFWSAVVAMPFVLLFWYGTAK